MKIEIRTDCKVCGGDLPNSRFRTYCSGKCRRKFHNKKHSHRAVARNRERRKEIRGGAGGNYLTAKIFN